MNGKTRPPIVAIMGHVDHGKTTLMDYIQHSNIAAREVGGITQSIRAFNVPYKKTSLTFIDTPGHEAFSKMRQHGSQVADIILLVVAADDGVKPQTKEVIELALRDKIPMVVAINKIDLPGADVNRVKMELSQHGVLLEGWGGNTVAVEISAKTGKGVDHLLEMLALVAEREGLQHDEKANQAIVLESYLNKGAGPESLVIVKSGRLKVGDFVFGENNYGKIRAIVNDKGERIPEAEISMPVRILGLEKVLQSGEQIGTAASKTALKAAQKVVEAAEAEPLSQQSPLELLDALMKKSKEEEAKPVLNIVIKADTVGSLEAITGALQQSKNEKVTIHVIRDGTGEITESDILFAKSARAVVIGFNAVISGRVQTIAQRERVIIMNYHIIYELIDDVVSAAESLIPPEISEVYVGEAEVVDVFTLSNGTYVAGSIVKDGKLVRNYNCVITRGGERVFEGKIVSIRRFKEEVKDVSKGTDCGIAVSPNFECLKGDVITCVRIEKS